MEKLNTILQIIKGKFPDQKERIEQLYEQNTDFQTLCADYYASMNELKKIRELSREGYKSLEDYKNVINDLEKDLQEFIFPPG